MSDLNAIMPIAHTQTEVAEQPAVVARVLNELQSDVRALAQMLAELAVPRLYLLGSGDSWFAGLATRLAFEEYAGLLTEPLQAYEYAAYGHPGLNAQSAAILISSSGRPTTTWDALDRALAAGAYVGITDNPYDGNPFVDKPHSVLIPAAQKKAARPNHHRYDGGPHRFGHRVGSLPRPFVPDNADALSNRLGAMPAQMQAVLTASANQADALAQALQGRHVYTLVGGGPSYGVAQIGSCWPKVRRKWAAADRRGVSPRPALWRHRQGRSGHSDCAQRGSQSAQSGDRPIAGQLGRSSHRHCGRRRCANCPAGPKRLHHPHRTRSHEPAAHPSAAA
ncbi:MAG: hypothetical protein R2911_26040 [Caldilineaceae bacterium]